MNTPSDPAPASNFLREIIAADLEAGTHEGRVVTRFPPEPNGYLHIGHAKSICLNFGLAKDHGGACNLRFDDTNPETEDTEFVEAIQRDVRWLGFEWPGEARFASNYFEQFYAFAEQLVKAGKAYVDSSSDEEIRELRGTLTEPGRPGPYRDRSVEENLDLLRRMRAGEFGDGEHVLRAKIDLASPNMKMRDPLLYRIRHAKHHRTGDDWCIYPFYDYAHCLEDAIEGVTHSICTLEFENNRDVYDWVLGELDAWNPPPRQYEFARLHLTYTVMSKRKLGALVANGSVDGWDDPRLPTLAGLRRRGYTPEAIRAFCDRIGVAKANSTVDVGLLEHAIRDDLNHRAPRVMAVLKPLEAVISSVDEGAVEWIDAPSWPHDVPKEGSRKVPFERTVYIERTDFQEEPEKGFKRLAPGREVRLRYAYVVRCDSVEKDPQTGEIVRLHCTHDPETLGKNPTDRKISATIHWVAADNSHAAELRLYDRLFQTENPSVAADGEEWTSNLNPNSLERVDARVEWSLGDSEAGRHFQFERTGYFHSDPVLHRDGKLVFNRTVSLRDSWAKKKRGDARGRPTKEEKAAPKPKKEGDTRPARKDKGEARERARKEDPAIAARYARYTDELGVAAKDAERLADDESLAALFEEAVETHANGQAIANWVINEAGPIVGGDDAHHLTGKGIGELVALVDDETISGKIAKKVFAAMAETGDSPGAIVESRGLRQITDPDAIGALIDQVFEGHPDVVEAVRGGDAKRMGFLVGATLKASGGKANPGLVNRLLRERLK